MNTTNKGMPFEDLDPEVAAVVGETQAERRLRQRLRHPLRLKLTDDLVRTMACGPQERWVLDTQCRGLALRIRPTGNKSFYFLRSALRHWEEPGILDDGRLRRRGEGGPRRDFVGDSLDFTVDQAREKVKRLATGIYVNKPPRKLSHRMRVSAVLTAYFQDNQPESSDWFKTVKGLFDRYVVPRFGNHWLSGISRERWLTLVETVALDRPSRGTNFFKALKSFLSWAVERGLLQAHPLWKTKFEVPLLPDSPKPKRLHFDDLVKIGRAARELSEPWSTMVVLFMLTGKPMEQIRQIKGPDIDWDKKIWAVDRQAAPKRTVRLSPEAVALIQPYRAAKGNVFLSPRTRKAINFHAGIMERLRQKTPIFRSWSLRDLRRAVRKEIDRLGEGDDAILLWSQRFTAALKYEEVAI
jgi:integrase